MSVGGGKMDTTARQLPREAISRFSLQSKYFSPDRIKLPFILDEGESADIDLDGARELQATGPGRPASKKRSASGVSGSSKPPNKKKPSRQYAPPETYEHLAYLPDYLKDNLDGKQGPNPRKLSLTNVFCSHVLWYKVSHAPHA